MRILIGIFLIMLTVSCHRGTHKETPVPTSGTATTGTNNSSDEMYQILLFELARDTATRAGERCTFVRAQTFNGHLKKGLSVPSALRAGEIVCLIYDAHGQVKRTIVQEDPLMSSVEEFQENGTMIRHESPWDKAELILRVQKTPEMHQLVIGKVMPDLSIQTLTIFQL